MSDAIGKIVEGGMAVHLVISGIEQSLSLRRVRSGDVLRLYYPEANAFVAAGVNVSSVFDGHRRIGRVEAANVFVVQTTAATDKNFPEGPIVLFHLVLLLG